MKPTYRNNPDGTLSIWVWGNNDKIIVEMKVQENGNTYVTKR